MGDDHALKSNFNGGDALDMLYSAETEVASESDDDGGRGVFVLMWLDRLLIIHSNYIRI